MCVVCAVCNAARSILRHLFEPKNSCEYMMYVNIHIHNIQTRMCVLVSDTFLPPSSLPKRLHHSFDWSLRTCMGV